MSDWCQPDPKTRQMSRWPDVVLLLATKFLHWGGVKIIKMAWDLCSSPPCIPFYPYTMFQNPMPKPSCHKSRKTIITQKVLVTQSSNIVHCDWKTIITQKVLVTQSSNIVHCDRHTQKPKCADFQAFLNTFSLFKLMFFFSFFVRVSSANSQKCQILLISTGKNASKWLEWHEFRVSRHVLNPMELVSSLYHKWFLKNQNFRRQVSIKWG